MGGREKGRRILVTVTVWLFLTVTATDSGNRKCIPTAHRMPILEQPETLVRPSKLLKLLARKQFKRVMYSPSRYFHSRWSEHRGTPALYEPVQRTQTKAFISRWKQTQKGEAASGGCSVERLWDQDSGLLLLCPGVFLCSVTPGRSPVCWQGALGTPPPRLFVWGGPNLCFRWGSPAPFPQRLALLVIQGSPPICGCKAWWHCLHPVGCLRPSCGMWKPPSQLASCRCELVAKPSSLQEKRVTDGSLLQTLAPGKC